MKASEILEVVLRSDGLLYIEENLNQKGLKNKEKELQAILELWDSAEDLKAENERLREENAGAIKDIKELKEMIHFLSS